MDKFLYGLSVWYVIGLIPYAIPNFVVKGKAIQKAKYPFQSLFFLLIIAPMFNPIVMAIFIIWNLRKKYRRPKKQKGETWKKY